MLTCSFSFPLRFLIVELEEEIWFFDNVEWNRHFLNFWYENKKILELCQIKFWTIRRFFPEDLENYSREGIFRCFCRLGHWYIYTLASITGANLIKEIRENVVEIVDFQSTMERKKFFYLNITISTEHPRSFSLIAVISFDTWVYLVSKAIGFVT